MVEARTTMTIMDVTLALESLEWVDDATGAAEEAAMKRGGKA
jgi:hypothetical protein